YLTETFAKTERALKSEGFLLERSVPWAPYPLALADWQSFGQRFGPRLILDQATRRVLLEPGPMVELVVGGNCQFYQVGIPGESDGERAINSAKQVRNNLFHGSKLLGQGEVSDDDYIRAAIS